MKALVITGPNDLRIRDVPTPECGSDEVLIKVRASGICGTDVHILAGSFPATYPLIPGHEFAGEVIAVGDKCSRIRVGDRVAIEPNIPCNNCPACLRGDHHYCQNMLVPGVKQAGGFGEYVAVKEYAVFNIGSLDYVSGALVEPLSCVIHSLQRLSPEFGDKVLVMGAGPIGLLIGRTLRARGVAKVDYLERLPDRQQYAREIFQCEVFTAIEEVADFSYESVIDATGISPLVEDAANRLVRARGKVLIFGVPKPGQRIGIDHFRAYRDEISVIGSYTSIKNSMQAIDLMLSGTVNHDGIVSHCININEIPHYIERMRSGDGSIRKVVITSFT